MQWELPRFPWKSISKNIYREGIDTIKNGMLKRNAVISVFWALTFHITMMPSLLSFLDKSDVREAKQTGTLLTYGCLAFCVKSIKGTMLQMMYIYGLVTSTKEQLTLQPLIETLQIINVDQAIHDERIHLKIT